jgi:hypothetical protein
MLFLPKYTKLEGLKAVFMYNYVMTSAMRTDRWFCRFKLDSNIPVRHLRKRNICNLVAWEEVFR